ncbi:MAG: PAS domain-containing protein, partial [Deltaproteobacteria bacterium]|nr:PAS domain-containing protein [Deltaproteobacteria bacterium]
MKFEFFRASPFTFQNPKRDQLEQQLAEVGRLDRTLTDRTRHLNAILEHTTVAIYLKDADSKYILVNEQYEKLAQVQSEEIRGKTDFDIFPEPVASLFRAQDQEVIEKNALINFEETIPLPDGIHS